MGLAHHVIEQRTVTRATFQAFVNELVVVLAPRVPINEEVFIIFDGAQSHLNIVVPPELEDRFHVVMLPPYCQFCNPVEQAHSCLKSSIKQHLVLPHIQAEILDIQNMRAKADLSQRVASNWEQRTSANYTTETCKLVRAYSSVYSCISQSRNHSRLNQILLM